MGRWRPRGDPLAKTPRPHLGSPSQALFHSLPSRVCFLAPAGICPPESPRAPRASLVICPWASPPPHQTLTSRRRQSYQVRTESSPCPASSRPRIPPIPRRRRARHLWDGAWRSPAKAGVTTGPGVCKRSHEAWVQEEARGLCKCERGAEQRLCWARRERGRTVPETHSSSPARVLKGAQPRKAGHRGAPSPRGAGSPMGAGRAS